MIGPAPSTSVVALEARNVSVRYGPRPALVDVSTRVRAGELVALVGPNGSGKTTLIRSALGLVRPSSGEVEVFGSPVGTLSISERAKRTAWVPQDESPYENVPVLDYVLYGRNPHIGPLAREGDLDLSQARVALEAVGLWDRRADGILELSGGERQRILLARALAQATPLLLLDEPMAHLDVSHQLELLERVRALCRTEGKAALAAVHDLNLAARYADRIVVLSRGRVVADGPPRAVLSEALLFEVWGILAEIRDDRRTGLPYLVPRLPSPSTGPRQARPGGGFGPVHVVAGGGSGSGILRALVAEGYRVTAGALPMLDSDADTAAELDVPIAAEAPFAPLSEEVRARNRALLDASVAIVVAPFAVGPSNLANLEDLLGYAGRVPMFAVQGGRVAERDFSEGRATSMLQELLRNGAVETPSVGGLLEELRRLAKGPSVPAPSGTGSA
ncbi:MAG: ABC transporter ATP-binding protein [Thermoplasmata archaeon]|nr:ABC transporter ATP-binding protein [Thermoplasmata archaeon]